jgi:hypothetical protein
MDREPRSARLDGAGIEGERMLDVGIAGRDVEPVAHRPERVLHHELLQLMGHALRHREVDLRAIRLGDAEGGAIVDHREEA